MQIATILWSESRLEIPELPKVKEQFTAKYGKAEIDASVGNTNSLVSPAVITALQPPVLGEQEVTDKLREVAAERGVQYRPSAAYTEVSYSVDRQARRDFRGGIGTGRKERSS